MARLPTGPDSYGQLSFQCNLCAWFADTVGGITTSHTLLRKDVRGSHAYIYPHLSSTAADSMKSAIKSRKNSSIAISKTTILPYQRQGTPCRRIRGLRDLWRIGLQVICRKLDSDIPWGTASGEAIWRQDPGKSRRRTAFAPWDRGMFPTASTANSSFS